MVYQWLSEHLHLKLLGQSVTDLNYRVALGNEEEEGSYNHDNKNLEAVRENKYLNIKLLPKQTHSPGISSLHQTETLSSSKAKTVAVA